LSRGILGDFILVPKLLLGNAIIGPSSAWTTLSCP
jgi:hypothetical protein